MNDRRRYRAVAVGAALVAIAVGFTAWQLRDRSTSREATPQGAITIDTRYEPDSTKLDSCAADDERCARRALGNLAFAEGARPALEAMVQHFGSDGDATCHQSAHEIGRASLAHYDGSVGDAFAAGTPDCFSGYYHGLFETAFESVARTPDALGRRAKVLCDSAESTRTGFDQYNCLHGVGHGLLIATADIDEAGHACRHIVGSGRAVECFGGAIMEALSPSSGGESPFVRDDDLEYPCNALSGSQRAPCYSVLAGRLLEAHDSNWPVAAAGCLEVDPTYRGVCIWEMGGEAANLARWRAPAAVARCRRLPAYVDRCLGGAAAAIMGNYHDAERGLAVCAAARGLPIDDCRASVARFISLFATSRDAARKRCAELVPEVPIDECSHPLAPA